MAEPFYLYIRRKGGNYYVQFRLEDGQSLLLKVQELQTKKKHSLQLCDGSLPARYPKE